MKLKLVSCLICVLILSVSFSIKPQASGMLFVSPTRINLNEKDKVETINVSNVTNEPSTYKISIEDLVMTEAGSTVVSDKSPYSAKKMLRFFPREFTVQPGQHQTIRIMAKISADLPDGEYHAHIKFFEDVPKAEAAPAVPGGDASKARARAVFSYSTLLPIIVSKGKVDTKVGWIEPTIKAVPGKPGSYKITSQLTREGNGQGNAYIDVLYAEGSKEPVQIGKRRTAYIYREIDKKNFSHDFKLPEGASGNGKIIMRLYSGDAAKPTPVTEASLAIP